MSAIFDIALVFSAHEWVESFHRYCTNTGVLRIRSLVYDSAVLSSEIFDACIISDTHPTLSRGLVKNLHENKKLVLGVCDDSKDSLEFLSSIGVDAVFSSRTKAEDMANSIQEFLSQRSLEISERNQDIQSSLLALDDFTKPGKQFKINEERKNRICVVGCGGTGATEVSIALSDRLIDCVLVDLDFENPSIGPRIGLEVEPNLMSAIEESTNLELSETLNIQRTISNAAIVGVTHSSFARDIKTYEITSLMEKIDSQYSNAIFDLGKISPNSIFWELDKVILQKSQSIVLVGDPTPVGILRVLESLATIHSVSTMLDERLNIIVIINKTKKGCAQLKDISLELQSVSQVNSIHFLYSTKELYNNSWSSKSRCPKVWKSNIEQIIFELEAVKNSDEPFGLAANTRQTQEIRTKISA